MQTDAQILQLIKTAYPSLTSSERASLGDQVIANTISTDLTQCVPTMIGPGAVLNALGPAAGAAVMAGIQAAAGTNMSNPLYWGLQVLLAGNLDVSLAATQSELQALVSMGTMTQAQMNTLVTLSAVPDSVSVNDVSRVLNENGY